MLPPIAEAGDSAEAGMLDSKPIFIAFVILVVLGLELLGGEARLLARSNRLTSSGHSPTWGAFHACWAGALCANRLPFRGAHR